MQRAHKRKIKVLVVDAAMMFAAVQMTVCMHGKQRYTASAQDVSGYEVSIEDNTQTITTEEPQETFKTEYTSTIMNEEILYALQNSHGRSRGRRCGGESSCHVGSSE